MARAASREIHSPDYVDHSNDGAMDFSEVASYNTLSRGGHIEPITEREWKTAEEAMAFMEEPLTIEIHVSSDKNAPPAVPAGVQGKLVWFLRGTKIRNVPRKYVEVLARSQSTAYKTQQVRDPNADEQMQTLRSTSQDYSFSVLHDPNPKGRQWLERVTREG